MSTDTVPVRPDKQVPTTLPTVLLVEDDRDLRHVLTALFQNQGWAVIVAPDGPTAIHHASGKFSIAIVDMLLPGASGFQVVEAVRNHQGPDVPVVMMSGNCSSAQQNYAAVLGISRFLAKPFPLHTLLAIVHDLIAATS